MSRFAALAAQPTYPCLPSGMTFGHLVELIERHARRAFGIGLARRDALLRMMRSTSVSDWTDPHRDPVCYRAQQDMAAEIGITDRALRAHERHLEALGLVLIDTAADGHRSGAELSGGRRLGINFRPLIQRVGELIACDRDRQAEGRRIQTLRLECSALKRDVRRAIERLVELEPRHPALGSLLQAFAAWPRRYAGFRTVAQLEGHLADIRSVYDQLAEILSCRADSSGVSESRIPAILNTNLKNPVSCSGSSANNRTARKRADTNPYTAGPKGPPGCSEKNDLRPGQGRKPELTETFTPDQLYAMASDDMRLYLDSSGHSPDQLTDRDFISAAIASLVDLGIRPSAWEDAAEVMGNLGAALTVLVIDANRFRSVEPVRKPGAMLCAMTRIAARSGLNLHGSLIRLKQWKIFGKS
ncbi:replication initiation protein RepC [Paracoccus versutus]|uniref:Replication initiation protein RepC n=1 Tax=Paracoccus versutus TaxID=34007 RepID=A0AAQ0HDH6_PARVE|nr:replication initiation protein RepC [Paracoccus versutus]REG28222.1 replication initiation protein RepC [Paracoccus versutus]